MQKVPKDWDVFQSTLSCAESFLLKRLVFVTTYCDLYSLPAENVSHLAWFLIDILWVFLDSQMYLK